MPLWLEHLLEDPGLGLELVAGRGGLRERGPVRWAHISEIPDPTPWLEGGEILLTTGMGVRDNPTLQRKLVAGLAARGCAAVGFGLGVCLDDVPDAMLAEADERALPLFTVPYEVPFIAVTKRVSRHIFDEHYATLRGAVDLHRQVLASVLSGSGVDGVLATVTRPMPGFAYVLYDYYGDVLAQHEAGGLTATAALWAELAPELLRRDRVETSVDGRVAIGSVVRLGDQVEAVLVLVGERGLHEHEALLLEQGLAGISLELARGLSAREAHRQRVDDLLAEVAGGRLGHLALEQQLHHLGVDPAGYEVLCIARPAASASGAGGPVSERSLCALVEHAVMACGRPVVGRWDGAIHCIVAPGGDAAERVADAISGRGWAHLPVGRSRTKRTANDLAAALREAEVAATVPGPAPGGVRDVAALGLSGLLAGIDDALGARAFVDHVLGPVLEHDAREGTQLANTLRAYQRHGCRPGPAADELCVHRHTLAYRLDRIRVLTGRDPRDGQHLLAFGLALELEARSRS